LLCSITKSRRWSLLLLAGASDENANGNPEQARLTNVKITHITKSRGDAHTFHLYVQRPMDWMIATGEGEGGRIRSVSSPGARSPSDIEPDSST